MGILYRFEDLFVVFLLIHLKTKEKKKQTLYLAQCKMQRVSNLTSCIPCPLGSGPNNSWGERWMDGKGDGDLMRSMQN